MIQISRKSKYIDSKRKYNIFIMAKQFIKKYSHEITAIIILTLGLFSILLAPKLSYEFTHEYFFPGGNGSYSPDDFDRMVYLYAISFYMIGIILSLISIVFFFKRNKEI
ncbi:hypothetical protein [Clostridium sp. ZS2-4]|uniref:hypothetical protein n=1 Tax=Clostridium sp. ZS2-4 TaxID=2987703 RepID=UPI00227A7114|nr:hypothetical protein [Clostridium sp. ZS2-4]MCY6356129.1 hypothetical protein [Clostridium sp. ZS2-4]